MSAKPTAIRLANALEQGTFLLSRERDATAAELRRLHQHELSNDLWHTKTAWVQESARPEELGMHRADCLRRRIERLHAENIKLWGRFEAEAQAAGRLQRKLNATEEQLDALRHAVAAEREACAALCDFEVARLHAIDEPRAALVAGICAAAIRGRSEG